MSFQWKKASIFLLLVITLMSVVVNLFNPMATYAAYQNIPDTSLSPGVQNVVTSYRNFEVACEDGNIFEDNGRWADSSGTFNNTGNYENNKPRNFPCVQAFLAFYKNRKLCYGKGLENGWTFKTGSPSSPSGQDNVKNEDYNEGKDLAYLLRVGKECVDKIKTEGRQEVVGKTIDEFEEKCGTAAKYNSRKSTCEDLVEKLAGYAECTEPSSVSDAKIKSYISDCRKKSDSAKADEDRASSGSTTGSTTKDEDVPCHGGPMGWVLCPLINMMTDGIRVAGSFIDSMMQFRLLADDTSGKALKDASTNFTTIANILLVIAFLFIIISQSTSLGMSSYGIKKMLPKLVITAILINISFYICAFFIDLSNIAGASIMGFMSDQNTVSAELNSRLGGSSGLGLFGAGVVAVAALVVLILFFLTPLLLGVLLTFVMLVARQIILICLVVLAPIALAAWLLPNTESFFNKWRKLFQDMLLAYPLVMFIFGAALWSAELIGTISIADNLDSDVSNPAFSSSLSQLIQLLVLAIPLLALPFILKGASAALGKVAGMAQKYGAGQAAGLGGKATGAAKTGLKRAPGIRNVGEMMEQRKSLREQAYGRNKAKRAATRASRGGATQRALTGFGQTGSTARSMLAGQAAGALQKMEHDEINNRRAVMQADDNYAVDSNAVAMAALETAHASGDQVGVRAAMAELSTNAWGVKNLQKFIQDSEASGDMSAAQRAALSRGINDNWSAYKSKDAAVAKWSTSTSATFDSVASDSSTYSGLKAEELSTQTDQSLARALATPSGVTKETAQAVLDSSDTQKNLTGDTRSALAARAGSSGSGTGGGSGTPPTPPTPPSPTPPPSGTPSGGPSGGGGPAPTPTPSPTPPPSGGGSAASAGGIPIRGTSSGGVILPGERRTRE